MHSMRKSTLIPVFFLVITLILGSFPTCQAGIVRPKSTFIQIMKTLCDGRPDMADYVSVGKSIDGNDIWLFRIGNPDGGRFLWDSTMHGGEDTVAECIRIFVNWLLNSEDARAEQYLLTNWLLTIPHLNPDVTSRQNHRRHYTTEETVDTPYEGGPLDIPSGVNLNRNFPTGWGNSGTSDITSTGSYRGIKGGSEPETRALMSVFETYQPDIYLNGHNWAGPRTYFWHSLDDSSTIIDDMRALQQAQIDSGLCPLPTLGDLKLGVPFVSGGTGGYAIAEANMHGIPAFLIEIDPKSGFDWEARSRDYLQPTLEAIEGYYYPRTFPHYLAFLDYVAVDYVPPPEEPTEEPPEEELTPPGVFLPPSTPSGPGDIIPDVTEDQKTMGAILIIAVVFFILYWKDIKKWV